MAYNQKPGRSQMPKTGRGVSAVLMSYSPMKQGNVELTEEYSKSVKKKAEARSKAGQKNLNSNSQGISIDAASGVARAKPYEKKFVAADKNKSASAIVSGEGKTIKQASGYAGKQKQNNENLRKEFVKDSLSTMNSRNRNAEQYNITSGAKSPDRATGREIQTLVRLCQAKRTRS